LKHINVKGIACDVIPFLINITNAINLKLLYCSNNLNIMKKFTSTLVLAMLTFCVVAQQKVLFKLAPTSNAPIKYEMINKMDIEGPQTIIMDMIMHMNLSFNEHQDSLLNIVGKYTYAKIDLDAGMMTASYDSSKEPANEMEKAFAAQFSPLLENELTYTMNKFGQIKDVEFPNVSDQIFDKSSVTSFGVAYPSYAIAVGESWTANNKMEKLGLSANAKYTFVEKNDQGYKVDCDITMEDASGNAVGTSKGHFIVHPKTFITVSSSTVTNVEMQGAKVQTTTELKEVK
jgi:hypothetical protein